MVRINSAVSPKFYVTYTIQTKYRSAEVLTGNNNGICLPCLAYIHTRARARGEIVHVVLTERFCSVYMLCVVKILEYSVQLPQNEYVYTF